MSQTIFNVCLSKAMPIEKLSGIELKHAIIQMDQSLSFFGINVTSDQLYYILKTLAEEDRHCVLNLPYIISKYKLDDGFQCLDLIIDLFNTDLGQQWIPQLTDQFYGLDQESLCLMALSTKRNYWHDVFKQVKHILKPNHICLSLIMQVFDNSTDDIFFELLIDILKVRSDFYPKFKFSMDHTYPQILNGKNHQNDTCDTVPFKFALIITSGVCNRNFKMIKYLFENVVCKLDMIQELSEILLAASVYYSKLEFYENIQHSHVTYLTNITTKVINCYSSYAEDLLTNSVDRYMMFMRFEELSYATNLDITLILDHFLSESLFICVDLFELICLLHPLESEIFFVKHSLKQFGSTAHSNLSKIIGSGANYFNVDRYTIKLLIKSYEAYNKFVARLSDKALPNKFFTIFWSVFDTTTELLEETQIN